MIRFGFVIVVVVVLAFVAEMGCGTEQVGSSPVEAVLTGAEYHVSPSGSDANSGRMQSPWRTLQHAANVVNPGDTVIVGDGVYSNSARSGAGSSLVNFTRGGTASAYVTFKAQNKWGAVIDGLNNTTHECLTFPASYIRIIDFEIKGCAETGISNFRGGQFLQIIGNHIHDIGRFCTDTRIGRDGIFLSNNNVVIERNLIHDIGRYAPGENGCSPNTSFYQTSDHGIYVSGANNVMIRNNVFYNNKRGWSVHVFPKAVDRLSVLSNTLAFGNPWKPGFIVIDNPQITNSRIINNIFYQPTTAAIYYARTPAPNKVAIQSNISTNALLEPPLDLPTLLGMGGMQDLRGSDNQEHADPGFANPSAHDFHLASGSPAIAKALPLSDVTDDFDGVSRPDLPSIGAYEFRPAP